MVEGQRSQKTTNHREAGHFVVRSPGYDVTNAQYYTISQCGISATFEEKPHGYFTRSPEHRTKKRKQ